MSENRGAQASTSSAQLREMSDRLAEATAHASRWTDERVFYGPHECRGCGRTIVKASRNHGGEEFDQPNGPVYPNTRWHRHDCEQDRTVVQMARGLSEPA